LELDFREVELEWEKKKKDKTGVKLESDIE
jgi:hypothetical protein